MLTVALLFMLEAKHVGRYRYAMMCGAAMLGAVGLVCYYNLLPRAQLNGGIVQMSIERSLISSAMLVIGLVATLVYRRRSRTGESSYQATERFMIFAILFCSVSLVAECAYLCAGLPRQYYIYKYGLHRVLILSFALPVAFTWLMGQFIRELRSSVRRVTPAVCSLALVCVGATGLYECYKIYRLGLDVFLSPINRAFPDPLFSDPIAQTINDTLTQKGSSYHGTLAVNWPSVMFLNSFMLHKELGEVAKDRAEGMLMRGLTHPPPAACVFWLRDGYFRNPPPLPLEEVRLSIATFEQRKDKKCVRSRDAQGRRYTLCHVCGEDTMSKVGLNGEQPRNISVQGETIG